MNGSDDWRSLDDVVDLPAGYQQPRRAARMSFQEILGLLDAASDRATGLQAVSRLADMGAMAVPYLLDALKDADQAVREAAAEALGPARHDYDLQALIVANLVQALDTDPASAVRWTAALSLGGIGQRYPLLHRAIIPPLAAHLHDPGQPSVGHARVAAAAAEALERIGTPEAYAALDEYSGW